MTQLLLPTWIMTLLHLRVDVSLYVISQHAS